MNTMNKNGFTIMELIVAISIGLVIMLAMYSLSEMGQRSSVSISQKVVTQQDTRAVLDLMAMEIRMASYNPKISSTVWSTIPDCQSMEDIGKPKLPVQGNKGIQIATANSIFIAMDLGAPLATPPNAPAIIGDVPNEYIMYSYDVNAGAITRNVSCEGNQIILGSAGSATMMANNATDPAVNLFTYWGPDIDNPDATHNFADIDITQKVIANPTKWIPQIRRVVITIVADTELADATTKKKRRMTYSTSVIVRNHVLSPPIPNT